MKDSIFRLYDIRGKYPEDLDENTLFNISSDLGLFFGSGEVVVGHDGRNSSPILYEAVCAGLFLAGIKVNKIGFCSSPMLVYYLFKHKEDGAVMVTASHNPKEYNGIKVFDKNGQGIGGNIILSKLKKGGLLNINFVSMPIVDIGKKKYFNFSKHHNQYANFLNSFLIPKKPLKIVVDCSNGATGPIWDVLKDRFSKKGIDVILINNKRDGNFTAHGPDPLKKGALNSAIDNTIRNKADFGVVFDGDGDRVIFIDNAGNQVRAEVVWRLIAGFEKNRTFVCTVVDEYLIKKLFNSFYEEEEKKISVSSVGHVFVRKIMKEKKASFGIENSGHYYFEDFNYSDSGIMATIKLINAVSNLPYSLDVFISLVPNTFRVNEIDVETNNKLDSIRRIETHLTKNKFRVSKIDGVSGEKNNIWCNVRVSNTEPLLRINIEGEDKEGVLKLKKELIKFVY